MNKFNKIAFISVLSLTWFLYGCQIRKYDSYDAEKYANNNLDIDVKSIFCTSEEGFNGSIRYDLNNDEKEVCFILGEKQGIDYVYSYGSRRNTKLINDEPSIFSSDLIQYLDDLEIEVNYWKYVYLEDLDVLVYSITTDELERFYIFQENSDYKFYIETSDLGLINITLHDLLELISDSE